MCFFSFSSTGIKCLHLKIGKFLYKAVLATIHHSIIFYFKSLGCLENFVLSKQNLLPFSRIWYDFIYFHTFSLHPLNLYRKYFTQKNIKLLEQRTFFQCRKNRSVLAFSSEEIKVFTMTFH